MLNAARVKEKDGAFAATTLTPLDFFNGALIVILAETLPFSALYLYDFGGDFLGRYCGIIHGIIDPLAILAGILGGVLLAGGLSLIPALKKAAPRLALPVAAAFFFVVWLFACHYEFFWPWIKHTPDLFEPLEIPASICELLLFISLLPVAIMPGWLAALLATKTSLGAQYWKFAGVRVFRMLLLTAALVLAGQAVSTWMYRALPPKLDFFKGTIENIDEFLLPDNSMLLGAHADGLFTWNSDEVGVYDETLRLTRAFAWPGKKTDEWMPSAVLLESGEIMILRESGMNIISPDDEQTELDWPKNQIRNGRVYVPAFKHLRADGTRISVSRTRTGAGLEVRHTDLVSGTEVSRHELEGIDQQTALRSLERIFVNWTDDFYLHDLSRRQVFQHSTDGKLIDLFHWPRWPWLFDNTDLLQPLTPETFILGNLSVHPDGQLIFAENSSRDFREKEGVGKADVMLSIYEPGGAPRSYLIETGRDPWIQHLILFKDRLLIYGSVVDVPDVKAAIWTIPLEKLGLRPLKR